MTNQIPYDPCGHTKLAVSDYQKSYLFYKEILEKLGYRKISDKTNRAGWATRSGYGILIVQANFPDCKYTFMAPGLHHLCLKAESKEVVNQIYEFLLKNNTFIFAPPQKYPDYTDKYYAIFFADPDGIKLEIAYY